jgi:hypothetical protein
MMFNDHFTAAANAMVGKMEEEIRLALDAHWPNGWTYDDVRNRCVLQRFAHDPVEQFCADGRPLLHIWPIEQEQEQTADGWVLRFNRKIRRLYTGNTGVEK